MTPGDAAIRSETDGAICWLTIDNPPRLNALTRDMWASIPPLVAAADRNEEIRVVVVTGAGTRAFSAGADISEFGANRTGAAAREYDAINHAAYVALAGCSKPTIAMVRGYCFGGACELAICCDFRIAATDAVFSVPAAKLSLGYNPRWIRPMLSVMSAARVKEMLYTGRRYRAEEAHAMGLANAVVAPERLRSEVERLAGEIADNAPLSIRAAKAAVDELTLHPEDPDLARLDGLVDACFASEDFREGQRAFLEKRKPRFRGR